MAELDVKALEQRLGGREGSGYLYVSGREGAAIIAALKNLKRLQAEVAELKESLDACMEDTGG